MSENLNLGQIISTPQNRDAIHIAVVPVRANERLRPGQRVGLTQGGDAAVFGTTIGVVDPYLMEDVDAGQMFWLFLNPGSITSLRHEWTHPAFEPVAPKDERSDSQKWLDRWAETLPISLSVVMDHADEWVREHERGATWPDYLVLGGLLEGESVPDEFWPHYEAVRGKAVPEKAKHSFFSCSC